MTKAIEYIISNERDALEKHPESVEQIALSSYEFYCQNVKYKIMKKRRNAVDDESCDEDENGEDAEYDDCLNNIPIYEQEAILRKRQCLRDHSDKELLATSAASTSSMFVKLEEVEAPPSFSFLVAEQEHHQLQLGNLLPTTMIS
jgi:hypothetical protein